MKPANHDPRDRAYRQAALVYGTLGVAIMAVTVASPQLLQPERRADLAALAIGAPFFVLFALGIAFLQRAVAKLLTMAGASANRAWVIGRWIREKYTMLLALSGAGRTFVFASNAIGVRPRLIGLRLEPAEPQPKMWVCVLMMAIIVTFLVRASWWPWLSKLGGINGSLDRR